MRMWFPRLGLPTPAFTSSGEVSAFLLLLPSQWTGREQVPVGQGGGTPIPGKPQGWARRN